MGMRGRKLQWSPKRIPQQWNPEERSYPPDRLHARDASESFLAPWRDPKGSIGRLFRVCLARRARRTFTRVCVLRVLFPASFAFAARGVFPSTAYFGADPQRNFQFAVRYSSNGGHP
jgi:hypothetical protein